MIKPDFAARVAACDLVPDRVIDRDVPNIVGFHGKDEHHKDDDYRNPEAPHVPFGLRVFIHRFQYSA